jgi:hypothetical protein
MIGKPSSEAYRTIRKETGLRRYIDNTSAPVDVIVNYGLGAAGMNSFLRSHRKARALPIINKELGISKYTALKRVTEDEILVPESKLMLSQSDIKTEWIEKKFYSARGYGIRLAGGRERMVDKYYQKFIKNRVYELRVAAFLWVPKSEWGIFKRLGDSNKIAWNFHQGGHFTSIIDTSAQTFQRAIDISEKALKVLKMGFGAVDFLVDDSRRVYFIEVNSAPGFSELSGGAYIHAFQKLPDTPIKKLRDIANE